MTIQENRPNPDRRFSVPLPLPEYLEDQLKRGLKAIELMRDIAAVTAEDTFEAPWLPQEIRSQVLQILVEDDESLKSLDEDW